jgi:hypothetical protein
MGSSNIIFPELHNWALVTGWCAALLIVSAVFFLIAKQIYHEKLHWQLAVFLLIIGIGVWSLIIAIDGYQQWLDIVHHAPVHGLIAYAHAINETYLADVFRCQIQFAVTVVLLVATLFMLCREILSHVLHGVGEVKSEMPLS